MNDILAAVVSNFPTFLGLVITIAILLRENGYRREEIKSLQARYDALIDELLDSDCISDSRARELRVRARLHHKDRNNGNT